MQLNTEALMNKWTHWQSWEKHTHTHTLPFTITSSFCQQPASNQCWFIYRHHRDESIKWINWVNMSSHRHWTSPINIKKSLCYCTFKTRSACHSICKWARFWLVIDWKLTWLVKAVTLLQITKHACKCDDVRLSDVRESQKFRTSHFWYLTSINAPFLILEGSFKKVTVRFHLFYFKSSRTIWFLQTWPLKLLNISQYFSSDSSMKFSP